MSFPIPGVRWHTPLAVLALLVAALALAPAAHAGAYQVRACDANGVNRALTPFGDTNLIAVDPSCSAEPFLGMKVRNSLAGSAIAPAWSSGGLRAEAPAGTVITAIHGEATATGEPGASGVEGWRAGITADNNHPLWCAGKESCAWSGPPGLPVHLGTEASAVHLVVYCALASGCRRDRIRAAATLTGVVIDVRDDAAPSIEPRGGLWGAGGWVSGTLSLGMTARDGAGVRSASAEVGGQSFGAREEACDFYSMRPCPDSSLDVGADTRRLADGAHTVVLRAVDAGGNAAERRATVSVDNVAPTVAAPQLAGSSGWRADNRFELKLDARDGAGGSGVQRVGYELCRTDGAGCQTSFSSPTGTLKVAPPGVGEWRVRAWASDALRSGDKSGWSETLRFDPTVPGRARVPLGDRWLAGSAPPMVAELPFDQDRGPSGVAGYAVATGARQPGTTVTDAGERAVVDLGDLPEGETRVRARAISGAGVPAAEVGEAVVRIDRTPPVVQLRAGDLPLQGRDGAWLRRDVRLTVSAHDQAGLSGMGGASDGRPVAEGAFVELQVDDGEPRRIAGGQAEITLPDGDHVVTVRATDLAGNTSAPQRASFRVDRAAPAGALRERSALAPNLVSAAVEEDCIDEAALELRPVESDGRWQSIPARIERRAVTAAVPDDRLEGGDYDARFRVRDCAGNLGLIDSDGDRAARLRLPLRAGTALDAALGSGHSRLTVPLGRPAALRGRLTTLDGAAIGGRRVEVQERIGAGSWRVRRVLVTDETGRVHGTLPAGPSRRVRLVAASTDQTIGDSSATLRIAVPARTTIRASRTRVRNGELVRFSGRLLGGHVPSGGRELELQGFNPLRGRWQPVRTQGLRSDGRGRWHTSYRFTATVGVTVTYRFRLRVAPRPDHPFADGHSRAVRVTVSG